MAQKKYKYTTMDIFFKKTELTVDCFTTNINAFELFPIQESKHFYPEWWKNLPKNEFTENRNGLPIPISTMKRCEGFINLYQSGFIIPLWSDIIIQTHGMNNYSFEFADGVSTLSYHNSDQLGPQFVNYIHIKFESPWRIQEKTGVNFIFQQPSWNNPSDLINSHVLPGIIDFKYQFTSSINLFILKNKRYQWAAGRPMAHVVPMSDKKIKLKMHLISEEEKSKMRVMNRSMPFFQSQYRKYKEIKESQCPFGKNNK